MTNTKDEIVNGAEEESAALKASMAADLARGIAKFQAEADLGIEEFKASMN